MNLSAHVSSLYDKKALIEAEIEFEQKRPLPNFIKLSELKKQKLALKQVITQFLAAEQPASAG